MSNKSSKAQQAKVATTYNINNMVLGKVRGFPPWPGMVVDPDNVHPTVALECPSNKKATFYCVRFFPLGDHPVRSGFLMPRGVNRNRNRSPFSSEVKRPDQTAKRPVSLQNEPKNVKFR
ncbi:uncharacterized protein LACBIDRAFT_334433 [Laccaria bicolor S238N-H82]|uniref:Predicted protein n=1 Tax=Laccaria bicolor (strain S238N-H82 / ATCC MYA-4686) TaxID=486041 RepID=B0DZ72_LACBS|nr:uncharacterized protein LACBIDRAFT_334433 [Laccaria bicolor S238N-H82]EDR00187.1 predicted protein [Laccaria bicolor S238N-H82]|eukprot:XP_001889244.1 predicted protein [Laccaria bicolor S238N-H82]